MLHFYIEIRITRETEITLDFSLLLGRNAKEDLMKYFA